MKIKNTRPRNKKKIVIIAASSVLVIALILVVLDRTNTISIFSKNGQSETDSKDSDAKTTSTTPSAQEDFKDGGDRQSNVKTNEDRGSGIITDQGGQIPSSVDKGQPITSSSGQITVFSPAKNSLIAPGQLLTGTSTLPRINYRIIDDVSGMITLGELAVQGGNFSGTIDFNTTATTGQIDIYATRDNGVEFSNIEIPIRFR